MSPELNKDEILKHSYDVNIHLSKEDYVNRTKSSLYEAMEEVKKNIGDGLEGLVNERVDNFVNKIRSHDSKEEGFDLDKVKVYIHSYMEYDEYNLYINYDYVNEEFKRLFNVR